MHVLCQQPSVIDAVVKEERRFETRFGPKLSTVEYTDHLPGVPREPSQQSSPRALHVMMDGGCHCSKHG